MSIDIKKYIDAIKDFKFGSPPNIKTKYIDKAKSTGVVSYGIFYREKFFRNYERYIELANIIDELPPISEEYVKEITNYIDNDMIKEINRLYDKERSLIKYEIHNSLEKEKLETQMNALLEKEKKDLLNGLAKMKTIVTENKLYEDTSFENVKNKYEHYKKFTQYDYYLKNADYKAVKEKIDAFTDAVFRIEDKFKLYYCSYSHKYYTYEAIHNIITNIKKFIMNCFVPVYDKYIKTDKDSVLRSKYFLLNEKYWYGKYLEHMKNYLKQQEIEKITFRYDYLNILYLIKEKSLINTTDIRTKNYSDLVNKLVNHIYDFIKDTKNYKRELKDLSESFPRTKETIDYYNRVRASDKSIRSLIEKFMNIVPENMVQRNRSVELLTSDAFAKSKKIHSSVLQLDKDYKDYLDIINKINIERKRIIETDANLEIWFPSGFLIVNFLFLYYQTECCGIDDHLTDKIRANIRFFEVPDEIKILGKLNEIKNSKFSEDEKHLLQELILNTKPINYGSVNLRQHKLNISNL